MSRELELEFCLMREYFQEGLPPADGPCCSLFFITCLSWETGSKQSALGSCTETSLIVFLDKVACSEREPREYFSPLKYKYIRG